MIVLIHFKRLSSSENLRLDFMKIIFVMGRGAKLPTDIHTKPEIN